MFQSPKGLPAKVRSRSVPPNCELSLAKFDEVYGPLVAVKSS